MQAQNNLLKKGYFTCCCRTNSAESLNVFQNGIGPDLIILCRRFLVPHFNHHEVVPHAFQQTAGHQDRGNLSTSATENSSEPSSDKHYIHYTVFHK